MKFRNNYKLFNNKLLYYNKIILKNESLYFSTKISKKSDYAFDIIKKINKKRNKLI